MTRVGSIIGHTTDYNRVGALRGKQHIQSKNWPKSPPLHPKDTPLKNYKAHKQPRYLWRWVPRMSRGFHFWQSQPLDKVTSPWLVHLCLPAMSLHTNWNRALWHWFISEKMKGEGWGQMHNPKANQSKWLPRNAVLGTYMELMGLEPPKWPLTRSC